MSKTEHNKQVMTERGLIYIQSIYTDKDEAVKDGYSYMFTTRRAEGDVYGKCLDNKGLRHECVLVKGENNG